MDLGRFTSLGLLGALGMMSSAPVGSIGGLFGRSRQRRKDREMKRPCILKPTPKQKRRAKAQAGRKAAHITKRRRG